MEIDEKIKEFGFKGPDGLMVSILDLKDENFDEEKLKKVASKIGSFSIVGGTTELNVPRFLRNKHYDIHPKDTAMRFSLPELFSTYEIYITPEKIERRTISYERNSEGYFACDDIMGKIERIQIDDPLQKPQYTFS